MHVAEAGFLMPYFSQEILEDTARSLIRGGKSEKVAGKYLDYLKEIFPDASKDVHPKLCEAVENHPSNRYVLAAALAPPLCDSIITFHTDHFKPEHLQHWGVKAIHPDAFLCMLCDEIGNRRLFSVIEKQVASLDDPQKPVITILDELYRKQITDFSRRMTTYKFTKDVIQIARKTLDKFGQDIAPNERVYKGNLYFLKRSGSKLRLETIKGRVLFDNSIEDKHEGSIIPEDVIVFTEVERTMKDV